jgi:hypothetical protein
MAQPAQTPTISINISSGTKVAGYVVVQWANKSVSTVTVKGSISATTSGEVLELFAQPFGKKTAQPVPGQSVTFSTSSTTPVPYSFSAKPSIATRYSVEVFASSTATSPLATSATDTVYMVTNQALFGWRSCNTRGNRPICHQTLKLYTALPASALGMESRKHLYFYFAVNLNPRHIPGVPRFLTLDTSARIHRVRRVSPTVYEQTITFSFRVNNDAYNPVLAWCTKDTESRDGVNLPGHHGCGARRIRSNVTYLG